MYLYTKSLILYLFKPCLICVLSSEQRGDMEQISTIEQGILSPAGTQVPCFTPTLCRAYSHLSDSSGLPRHRFHLSTVKPGSRIRPSPVPADGTPKCAASTASLTPLPATAVKGVCFFFFPVPDSSLVLLIILKYRGQQRSSHRRAIKLPSAQLPEEVTMSCCT